MAWFKGSGGGLVCLSESGNMEKTYILGASDVDKGM